MQVFTDINEVREFSRSSKNQNNRVGFVPTMGFLHNGHLSLIDRSKEENDTTVVSIFVNPTQFLPGEDYDEYPRDEEADLQKCRELDVDAVFLPKKEDMYPENSSTGVIVNNLTDSMCGISRGKGHFAGVCTVVSKLFNIVEPDNAYFGQKDIQQAVIINRMVHDLNFAINIEICPTVREGDGLAMSSRNKYLKDDDRQKALALYKGLCCGRDMIKDGEKASMTVIEAVMENILKTQDIEIDYIEIVDSEELKEAAWIENTVIIAGAVRIGEVRLIDNLIIHPTDGPWNDYF
ncbi:MAG: pantoate--beta-alanine ligase [Planctomycetota bacterium]|jgi:pantoate--beta-alanine ligase